MSSSTLNYDKWNKIDVSDDDDGDDKGNGKGTANNNKKMTETERLEAAMAKERQYYEARKEYESTKAVLEQRRAHQQKIVDRNIDLLEKQKQARNIGLSYCAVFFVASPLLATYTMLTTPADEVIPPMISFMCFMVGVLIMKAFVVDTSFDHDRSDDDDDDDSDSDSEYNKKKSKKKMLMKTKKTPQDLISYGAIGIVYLALAVQIFMWFMSHTKHQHQHDQQQHDAMIDL
eukprot:PhM_4_TR17903/c1_g1_i1/m.64807